MHRSTPASSGTLLRMVSAHNHALSSSRKDTTAAYFSYCPSHVTTLNRAEERASSKLANDSPSHSARLLSGNSELFWELCVELGSVGFVNDIRWLARLFPDAQNCLDIARAKANNSERGCLLIGYGFITILSLTCR